MSRFKDIWEHMHPLMTGGNRKLRGPIRIPTERTRSSSSKHHKVKTKEIKPQAGYVGIRVNQLYLRDNRRWFTEIEPVVYSATEFVYDEQVQTEAVVIGPQRDDSLPKGMVLQNTSVFGIHPYRGGDLVHTIILSRMPTNNIARSLLEVVEGISTVAGGLAGLESYTKIGGIVLDGFDKLVGTADLQPLVGAKLTFNPDRKAPLMPGYVALLDDPDVVAEHLWVIDDTLCVGSKEATAQPYRDSDFVLYEITAAPNNRRTDFNRLPFYVMWQHAIEAVEEGSDASWDRAKAALKALILQIYNSPDLVRDQRQALATAFKEDLVELRKRIIDVGSLSTARKSEERVEALDNMLASIDDLKTYR